jgi:hypothetical protein
MANKALNDFDFGDTGINGLFSIDTTLYALAASSSSSSSQIYVGSTEVTSVRIGSTIVNQIYIGSTKVFG